MSFEIFTPFHGKLPVWIILLCFLLSNSCNNKPRKIFRSPPGYDLHGPAVFKLPSELEEISGIAFYPKDQTLFAIDDENGWLYKIYLNIDVTLEKWKYSGGHGSAKVNHKHSFSLKKPKLTSGADFEDIVLLNRVFYSLSGDGNILAFKFITPDSVQGVENKMNKGKNEFEALFYDPGRKQLILICKDCEMDKGNSSSAFGFDVQTGKYTDSPLFRIDGKEIETKLGKKIQKFQPSAASVNPVTNQLYLISAINQLLLVTDLNGKVINVYELDPRFFKQPEGIAFTPGGDLFISNESAEIGAANILFFKYKRGTEK